jgi:hypothetical protein
MRSQKRTANIQQIFQRGRAADQTAVDQDKGTVVFQQKSIGFGRFFPMPDQMNTQNTVTGRKIICKHVPYLPHSHLSKKERHNRSFLIFTALVSQNSDLFLGDHGYQVNKPEDKAQAGNEAQNTCDQSNGVLGLEITQNTIQATDQSSQENLENDLYDLRQIVVHGDNGRIVRHWYVLLSK